MSLMNLVEKLEQQYLNATPSQKEHHDFFGLPQQLAKLRKEATWCMILSDFARKMEIRQISDETPKGINIPLWKEPNYSGISNNYEEKKFNTGGMQNAKHCQGN